MGGRWEGTMKIPNLYVLFFIFYVSNVPRSGESVEGAAYGRGWVVGDRGWILIR
jgi:hypothetical protein